MWSRRAGVASHLVGHVDGFVDSQSLGQDRLPGQIDDRAEIDAGLAFELSQTAEAHRRIGFGVGRFELAGRRATTPSKRG